MRPPFNRHRDPREGAVADLCPPQGRCHRCHLQSWGAGHQLNLAKPVPEHRPQGVQSKVGGLQLCQEQGAFLSDEGRNPGSGAGWVPQAGWRPSLRLLGPGQGQCPGNNKSNPESSSVSAPCASGKPPLTPTCEVRTGRPQPAGSDSGTVA